ncbi:hypothetical protein J6590_012412 [Homalodisca vitripennis]|nr:hypothetical protein J6590_012412 [Homalodisca vitripennis]
MSIMYRFGAIVGNIFESGSINQSRCRDLSQICTKRPPYSTYSHVGHQHASGDKGGNGDSALGRPPLTVF